MAVEIAGTCLHWSQPPHLRGPLSAKTVALAISSLLHSPSKRTTALLLHYSHQQRGIPRGGRRRASSSPSLGGENEEEKEEEEEFVNRINELTLNFKIEAESKRNQDAEISNSCDESPPSSSSSSDPFSISPEIPEPWPRSDGLALQKMERSANSIDLPLSLQILKRKKKKRRESDEMTGSASSSPSSSSSSSVKKAFSSMVFIVRELQSQVIRMREALFSSDEFKIQGTLARVQNELHASFVWLFHRIFSSTPTLMLYLMLLLANFTVFSITDHNAEPLPPTQSVSSPIEESENPNLRFNSSSVKTLSVCRSAAVGGGGNGGRKPPAIAGAADDSCSDRSSSSLGRRGRISFEAISMAASAWKRIVEETEMIRASERHEALMDPDTLRRFVSPVTAEVEPDDLSAYSATELSYRVALAENPGDALLLSNFAQFLFTVLRDHDSGRLAAADGRCWALATYDKGANF